MSGNHAVHKELYLASPEPHVAPIATMSYIGEGLRREETRSLIRSSDWADTVRRRESPDNGRSWTDWELVCREAPTQGEYSQSGGASDHGTGPCDPVSRCLIVTITGGRSAA